MLDPLIATGGTACAALAMIVDWGIPGEPTNETMVVSKTLRPNTVKDIKLLCILASQHGLKHVQDDYPDLEVISCRCFDANNINEPISQIWVAGMDKILTPEGIISPGLGDTVEFSHSIKVTLYVDVSLLGRSSFQYGYRTMNGCNISVRNTLNF